MKMGRWQETADWGAKRGPDPILQFFEFANNVLAQVARKPPAGQICEFLLDQAYFNGIGNYLRAEILMRAGLDPFQETANVFKNSRSNIQSTLDAMIEESSAPLDVQKSLRTTQAHDPGHLILFLARQIQLEVLANGGMNKYGSADEQARFKAWLRVYGKGKEVKVGSRSVHCTPEQRLGKQVRDLGTFVDAYPNELPPIYYKAPTLTIAKPGSAGATGGALGSNQIRPHTPGSPSQTSSSPAPSTFQINRVDEVILPCNKIIDLHVPVMTKLLLAITSLSRNGKLNFSLEPSIRELVIMGHPMAYAAWQAFEKDEDESELVDTFVHLSRKTEVQRGANNRLYQAIEAANEAANMERMQLEQLGFSGSSLPAPLTANAQAQIRLLMEKMSITNDLGPSPVKKKKEARHKHFASRSSSSSNSTSGSTAGSDDDADDEISDDERLVEHLTKAKKKKAVSHFGAPVVESSKKTKSKFDLPASVQLKATGKKSPFGTSSSSSFGASPSAPSASSDGALDLVTLLGEPSWLKHLSSHMTHNMKKLASFLNTAYATNSPPVYPPAHDIFTAFKLCPLDKVRVVILGQDPYHGFGQAHGLCFSVKEPTPPPPSLANIYKELATDIPGFKIPKTGDLTAWAAQGVFMLNTVLTVFEQKPNSHARMGWEEFTDLVIRTIAEQCPHVVFLLWGAPAHKKAAFLETWVKHAVLKTVHPSPLSAHQGWFGSKHFSKTNTLIAAFQDGGEPINWHLA